MKLKIRIVSNIVGRLAILSLLATLFRTAVAQDSLDQDYSDSLPRIAPSEPNIALSSFEINHGLKIEAIATEPMIIDPVAIAFDEFGRAFVVEMRGYSERGEKKLGRIRLLEDVNRDGIFDRSTVFADRFESPTAVACFRGGILVGDAPNIWFLKDTDRDNRADIRQVAYSGFGKSNIQQLLNNFQWGIDNRIYGAVGGNGGVVAPVDLNHLLPVNKIMDDPDSTAINFRGQDFAISLNNFQISSITGGGQFGMTFDRSGNRYVCSNSDHCQQIILDPDEITRNKLSRLGKTRISIATDGPAAEVFRISPIEPWRRVRTRLRVQGLVKGPVEGGGRAAGYFTSATGITAYHGDALPDEYAENLFIGDVGSNLVHRKKLIENGIAKKAVRVEQHREFLRSTDNWFRPVQIANGPDGSLIILDMYRENVEHPASLPELIKKHLDLNSGNNRGRLYRVVPQNFENPKRLLPGEASLKELVQMLSHPNGWHRQTAARLLAEGSWHELPEHLIEIGITSKNWETKIRAMYLLSARRKLDANQLNSLLQDPHPCVRVHALKISRDLIANDLIQNRIRTMTVDSDIRVRFHVALILGKLKSGIEESFVLLALRDGHHHWMQLALGASANERQTQILNRLLEEWRARRGTEDQIQLHPMIIELTRQIGQARSHRDFEWTIRSLTDLVRVDPLLSGEMLLQLKDGMKPLAPQLDQSPFGQQDVKLQALTDRVIEPAKTIAIDPLQSIANRVNAIQVLRMARYEMFASLMPDLLDLRQPPGIRREAIQTASHFSNSRIGDSILDTLPSMDPNLRRLAIITLLSRTSWTQQLLDRCMSGQLNPVLLEASARQRLMQHPSANIREIAKRSLGNSANTDRVKLVETYRKQLASIVGNVEQGRDVFRKSCVACHRLEDHGTDTGPNLMAYANQGGLAILTQVLDPNREVDPRYLSYSVLMDDGRALQGIIVSENATTVVLQDSEGSTITIARDEIEELKSSTLSLMPENLENEIDPQAMANLIEYLLSQGG